MTLTPMAQEDDVEYKPKNVLITGGAGFIGSHVTIRLVQKYGCYKVGGWWRSWWRSWWLAFGSADIPQFAHSHSHPGADPFTPPSRSWSLTSSTTARRTSH